MIKRYRLERKLNYNNYKHPIFLYAYRAFIDALAINDKTTLQKMCERNLYKKLEENYITLERLNAKYFCVTKDIKMKMKLLNTMIVKGVYIDWSKNLPSHYYTKEQDKVKEIYKRKV